MRPFRRVLLLLVLILSSANASAVEIGQVIFSPWTKDQNGTLNLVDGRDKRNQLPLAKSFVVRKVEKSRVFVRNGDKGLCSIEDGVLMPVEAAIRYYSELLSRPYERRPDCYKTRGLAYLHLGKNQKAVADFSQYIAAYPGRDDGYAHRAIASYRSGDIKQCLDDLDFIISRTKDPIYNQGWYALRGNFLFGEGRFKEALATFKQTHVLMSGSGMIDHTYFFALAVCPDEELRDGKTAVKLATLACQADKGKNSFTLRALAAAHAEIGEFDKAVEWQMRAVHLDATENLALEYVTTCPNIPTRDQMLSELKLYQAKKPLRTRWLVDMPKKIE